MKLITEELKQKLPPLYAQEESKDPIVYAKFFTPWTSWTWYVMEYDPEQKICFGLVDGLDQELGYFSIDDLEAIQGPGGLRIERDLYFSETSLQEVRS